MKWASVPKLDFMKSASFLLISSGVGGFESLFFILFRVGGGYSFQGGLPSSPSLPEGAILAGKDVRVVSRYFTEVCEMGKGDDLL